MKRLLVMLALVAVLCGLVGASTAGAYGEFPGDILYVRATATPNVYAVASTDTTVGDGPYVCSEVGLTWTGNGGVVGNRSLYTCSGIYSGPLK